MMRLSVFRPSLFRQLVRNERGNTTVIFSLILMPILVAIGAAADYSSANSMKAALQSAADAAALAGAKEYKLLLASVSTVPTQTANKYLDAGLPAGGTVSRQVSQFDEIKRVTVALSGTSSTTFMGLVGIKSVPVKVSATAGLGSSKLGLCLLALDPISSSTYLESGGSIAYAPSCTFWVNSSSTKAVVLSGGSKLTSAKNCFVGGVAQGFFAIQPPPENCGVHPDPFASMKPTTAPSCDHVGFTASGVVTLNPGVYCGGLTLSGSPTVKLNPGIYVIRNGKLVQSGGGTMTGDGVVFVIEGASEVNLSGGGSYWLRAPKTGPFAGFIFFQRPTANPGKDAHMSGTGYLYYEGVIYFPTQHIIVSGSGSTKTPSPFTAYIGKTFTYSGTSTLTMDFNPTKTSVPIPGELLASDGAVRLIN